MRSRTYILCLVSLVLITFNSKKVSAYNSENPDGHFNTHTVSSSPVPINYIFTGVILGISFIGMLAVRSTNKAINSKLKSQRSQGY